MAIAITIKEFLDGRGVEYDVLRHAPTPTASRAAQASHVPGDSLAKAVVLRRGGDFMLAVVPASCRVNLDRVEELMDERVALATEDEIEGLFRDCDRGAVPPLGSAYGLECIIDELLEKTRDIYFEAGDHASLVHLTQAQFNDLTWDAYHGRIAARP
jgi:Ala-tRNA(Pro) deacylase